MLQNIYVPAAPTFCMHVLHELMYVLHVPSVDARTYIEEKNYQLRQIRTAVRTYLLHSPDTRVPAALT